jgi:predicted MFS family arabinose efflux permease
LGIPAGSVSGPLLVELASGIKDYLGTIPGSNEKGSALFTLFSGLGIVLGNNIGGVFYQLYGNRITSDIIGILSFSMAILVFVLNIKPGYLTAES